MNYNKKICSELNQIAIPLIIQSVSSMLIGLADQMLVGRISVEAYSAVGMVDNLLYFIAGMLGSIAVAFQIKGSHMQREEMGVSAEFAGMFCGIFEICMWIGVIFALLGLVGGRLIFSVFYGLEGRTLEAALSYNQVICPYVFLQMELFTYNAYFKIRKNTKIILWTSTLAAVLNVALDYVFIFGKFGFPAMEEKGAAIGTVLSLCVQLGCYLFASRKDKLFQKSDRHNVVGAKKELLFKSLPLMGQEFLDGSVFVVFLNMIITRMGTIEMGAYLLVSNILNIVMIAMYMYGSATLTLVGESIPERGKKEMKRIPFYGCMLTMTIVLPLSVFCILLHNWLPRLISDDTALIAYASAIVFPLLLSNTFNPLQTVYKYALQGMDEERFVLYATAFANFLTLGIIFLLYAMAGMGLNAVFIGLFFNYTGLYIVYKWKFYSKTSEN